MNQETDNLLYTVKVYPLFKKSAKILSKRYHSFKYDFEELVKDLSKNPHIGNSLGNGLYKIRMKITDKGKGKSGGARIIAAIVEAKEDLGEVGLHYIYDKSDCESLKDKEIQKIIKTNLETDFSD